MIDIITLEILGESNNKVLNINTTAKMIESPFNIYDNIEYTKGHSNCEVSKLEEPIIRFLKGDDKVKLECVELIQKCYVKHQSTEYILFIIDYYFKKEHHELLNCEMLLKDESILDLFSYKFMCPNLNVANLIEKNLTDQYYGRFEDLVMNDKAPTSPYVNLTTKKRKEYLMNFSYRFKDMNSIKGKLTDIKLMYLSQNIKLSNKIYDKYFKDSINKDIINNLNKFTKFKM
jgi:hypothetical protein